MVNRILVFDLWSDLAHFRRIETTTSPLTYPFPTGTTIAGLLGAISGLPRDSYYNLFSRESIEYSFRILNPIKKIVIPISIVKTDDPSWIYLWKLKDPRTPTPYEFVKDPKYRLYIHFKTLKLEKTYKTLKNLLENHQTIYTPYLGISEMIANFKFIGDIKAIPIQIENKPEYLHSVASIKTIKIVPKEGKYGRETIPLYMDNERIVLEYGTVIYEANGKPLNFCDSTIYDVDGENVSFL